MKFKKYLIALAASGVMGAMIVPSMHAAEHTFTWSGNLRVEATAESADELTNDTVSSIEKLTTSFGGLADESTTGGDTYLQWNYGYTSDDGATTGSGFVRFRSDRKTRIGVSASSESDTYAASMKAEWEQRGFAGVGEQGGRDVADRDQFVTLTHKGSGVYYKIGREEWLFNPKGYTTDFLSKSKNLGSVHDNRFSGHKIGWSNGDLGVDVGLFLQRDNTGQTTVGRPLGFKVRPLDGDDNTVPGLNIRDVNGAGLMAAYNKGGIDVDLISVGVTSETNPDRGHPAESQEVTVTELTGSLTFGAFTPFLNLFSSVDTYTNTAKVETEVTTTGNNLGLSYSFGFADLVVGFGAESVETKVGAAAAVEATSDGTDILFRTSADPLRVALSYALGNSNTGETGADDLASSAFGVQLEYGF